MKIYIFGSTGMLGTYLNKYFKNKYEVICLNRDNFDISKSSYNDYFNWFNINKISPNDVLINAAGIIKQKKFNIEDLILVNSIFPHTLAKLKTNFGCNIIHVTTDCVYSGLRGNYIETDPHDCTDEYGKSKSLGENLNLTCIRTSIIGEENSGKKSLMEWVKSNKNKSVYGYTNHRWNGVTCLEFSKICDNIIQNNNFWSGIKHVYSPNTFNKYDLIKHISDVYELNLKVEPKQTDINCFRNLTTNQNFKPVTKCVLKQIEELKDFNIYN